MNQHFMHPHFEAQNILESLTWLAHDGLAGMTAETAELILVSEEPWAIVLDAAKARLLGPQGAPAPAPAMLTQKPAESSPAVTHGAPAPVKPAPMAHKATAPAFTPTIRPAWDTRPAHTPPRKMAGL